MIDEGSIVEALHPIFPSMAGWWLGAYQDYDAKFNAEEQLDLGPLHRAVYTQKMALKRMRVDPSVAGRFRPSAGRNLEFLHIAGQPANLIVLFKLITVWKGRLRTSNIFTDQQVQRRNGQLMMEGTEVIPIVVGPILRRYADHTASISRILIGEEGMKGFEWNRALFSDEGGGALVDVVPIQPILGGPRTTITLRDPLVAPAAPAIAEIGIESERIRQRAEKERKAREAKKDVGA